MVQFLPALVISHHYRSGCGLWQPTLHFLTFCKRLTILMVLRFVDRPQFLTDRSDTWAGHVVMGGDVVL